LQIKERALKVIEDGPLGGEFGNKLATALPAEELQLVQHTVFTE
jgi:hypothetical protein